MNTWITYANEGPDGNVGSKLTKFEYCIERGDVSA